MTKPVATPEPSMEDRMKAKREELIDARDDLQRRAQMELNGIENQIYIIDQLLNPKKPESPTEGAATPKGTV